MNDDDDADGVCGCRCSNGQCGGDLVRATTPCGGRLTGSGVAERRAVNDADIITARYTDGGHAPANATTRSPKTALAGIRGHSGTTAKASGGWRWSSMAGVQDDCSGSLTMAAGAPSDRGEPFLKACDRLAFFDQHGDFDGDGRWAARHFSSDSPSLAVDIIRRQIAVSFLRRRPCVCPYVCAQI
jgi:hypothetical protein